MANTVKGTGQYTVKETGEAVVYEFDYQSFSSIDDALEAIGEVEALKLIQRQTKVDCNNVAREKAKTANGHSTRIAMTEEEKTEKKAERASKKVMTDVLLTKSRAELLELGIPEATIDQLNID